MPLAEEAALQPESYAQKTGRAFILLAWCWLPTAQNTCRQEQHLSHLLLAVSCALRKTLLLARKVITPSWLFSPWPLRIPQHVRQRQLHSSEICHMPARRKDLIPTVFRKEYQILHLLTVWFSAQTRSKRRQRRSLTLLAALSHSDGSEPCTRAVYKTQLY